MDLATEILTARKHLDLSLPKAAKAWKLNPRTLEQWEQGRRTPRGAAFLYLRSILDPILASVEAKPASASSAAASPAAPASSEPSPTPSTPAASASGSGRKRRARKSSE